MLKQLLRIGTGVRNLGFLPAVSYKLHRARSRLVHSDRPYTLRSKYAKYPLYCRPGTSDVQVFSQIFVGREYRCLDEVTNPGLIVDCGANVGYSSAYFLSAYPHAQVIAIEPDAGNYAALVKNLEPFGTRVRTLCSAVWSEPVDLVFAEHTRGEGLEWARSVRKAQPGDKESIRAVDLGTVLRESGHDRISILKIDVEGAEAVLFSQGYDTWLARVDNLVIELHGPQCEAIFRRAIAGHPFEVSASDELTVCKRTRAAELCPPASR